MLARLIGLCLAASTACGSAAPRPSSAPPPSPEPTAPPPAEPEDAKAPALDPATLVGSYKTEGTDFEELTLEADGSWSSFLHARPLYSGTWRYADGVLSLGAGNVDEPIVLRGATQTAGGGLAGEFRGKPVTWARIATD
jgi:hypothetical protein